MNPAAATPFTLMYRPRDFDGTVAFLRDVIELELVSAWDDDGRGAIFAVGTGRLELFWDANPDAARAARPHRPTASLDALPISISWQVDDVDQTVERWQRNGATIVSAPTDTPWYTRMAVATTPDGLLLCPTSPLP